MPLTFPKFDIGLDGGADALVRSRPPGRLPDGRRMLIRRGKGGTRASRADQGSAPPNTHRRAVVERASARVSVSFAHRDKLKHVLPSKKQEASYG